MRLMISVVSADEAREAMNCGALFLDVKNPNEGSLGAQFPSVIRQIRKMASRNVEVSAAIGDMPNLPGTAALAALGAAVCGADYIKVGLYGPQNESEAVALLRAVKEAVGEYNTSVIAAGYADYGALDPRSLPHVAEKAGIQGCLIDTASKNGRTLFDFLDQADLTAVARDAHARSLLFGAAGALDEQHLPVLRDAGADVAGLRTAVCLNGQRNAALDPARLRGLMERFGMDVLVK